MIITLLFYLRSFVVHLNPGFVLRLYPPLYEEDIVIISDTQLVILMCVDVLYQGLVRILKEGIDKPNASTTHE